MARLCKCIDQIPSPFFVDSQPSLSSAQCFPSIGLPYTADGWCGNADECGVQSVSRRNLIIRSPNPVSSGFDFALPRLNRKPPLNKSNKKRKENTHTQTPTLTLTYQNTKWNKVRKGGASERIGSSSVSAMTLEITTLELSLSLKNDANRGKAKGWSSSSSRTFTQ